MSSQLISILFKFTFSRLRKISKYKSQMLTVNKPRDNVNGIFPSPVYAKKSNLVAQQMYPKPKKH